MYLLKKLTRFHYVLTMIEEYNQSIEKYVYGTRKNLGYKKEEIKCNNIRK